MNLIYNVIWNHSLLTWIVVSELGRGRTKSSTPKANSKPARNASLFASALLVVSGNVYAYNVNGYTDFNSSTSISDGLQWNGTATVQVDQGADVTVSNTLGSSALNMNPAAGGYTSLWMNGGTLTG